ncbi:MAG: ATP-binding protein [Candidatus Saccharibacteria bacterium]|nr:ATP-binding protein [Candidatus Saccharibacteria bacterium]
MINSALFNQKSINPICQIQSLDQNVITIKPNHQFVILKINHINFDLFKTSHKDFTLKLYAQTLNCLKSHLQILIQVRQKPLEQTLAGMSNLIDQIGSSSQLVSHRDFYLIFSQTNGEPEQLLNQVKIFKQQFNQINLQAETLSIKESLEILHQHYNLSFDQKPDFKDLKSADVNLISRLINYDSLLETPQYLKINHQFVQILNITDYPSDVNDQFLDILLNSSDNISLSYHIRPIDSQLALWRLNRKITELQSTKSQLLKRQAHLDPNINQPLSQALKLREALVLRQSQLFEVGIYIAIFAFNQVDLNQINHQMKNLAGSQLFKLETAQWQQLEAWQACLPLGQNPLKDNARNFDTPSLALSFPFKDSRIIHPDGVFYGLDKLKNSVIAIDRFQLANANSVTFAQSGAGKSYCMKLEILSQLIQGVQVIVIDPENEYQNLTQTLKPHQVSVIDPSMTGLNLLQTQTSNLKDQNLQLTNLIYLIEIMLGQLSDMDRNLLDKALREIYAKASKPNLTDLYRQLKLYSADKLCYRIERWIDGSLSFLFNSDWQFKLDRQLTIFNIKALPNNIRPLIILLISHLISNQIVNQPQQKRLLVIDEAWLLLESDLTIKFINDLVRRARKYYLGVALISQQILDFYQNQKASTLISQTSLKILLRQDATHLDLIAQQLNLNSLQKQLLASNQIGQALILADDWQVSCQITSNPTWHQFITTKPSEIYNDSL